MDGLKPFDAVKSPKHYAGSAIETIDFIRDKMTEGEFVAYCVGNVIKYASRQGKKANAAEDLAKAAWYAQMAAHTLEPTKHTDPRL